MDKKPPRTRLATLGILAGFHRQSPGYDLNRLRSIISDLEPDLLCAEFTQDAWEGGNLSDEMIEEQRALSSVVASTDVVLVPVSPTPHRYADFAPASGFRQILARALDRLFRWGQRMAGKPEAINGTMFGLFCHTVCFLIERTWTADDRRAWEEHNRMIAENILQSSWRDPGRRVLVAVECQRLHRLRRILKAHRDEVEIIPYQEL